VGHKLLIVEDNAMVREMFAVALADAGFSVITAADGVAGLDRARAEHPDLILTDVEMPNLDGIEMIERLRQEPESQGIPVLVLSAVHASVLQHARVAGASEIVQKPVQIAFLIHLIKQTLGTALAAVAALSILLRYIA
jgi:two-component system, chemotaxis family, chemotaxis protein CheY